MDEKKIEKLMKNLGLTRQEAINLYCEDEGIDKMSIKEVTSDLSAEQKKTIKKMSQAQESKPREKKPRERKVDETKKRILSGFTSCLSQMGANVKPLTTEAEMQFSLNGDSYTIKLIKHRPPKTPK